MRHIDYTGDWPWKNFSPDEIACRCCGEIWKGEEMPEKTRKALDALQKLRDAWGTPIYLTSGHRCAKHNKEVNGASQSQHLEIAFDCICLKEQQEHFCELAKNVGFTTAVPYPNRGFCHLDMGRPRTW